MRCVIESKEHTVITYNIIYNKLQRQHQTNEATRGTHNVTFTQYKHPDYLGLGEADDRQKHGWQGRKHNTGARGR